MQANETEQPADDGRGLSEGLGGRFDAWMRTSASTVDLNGSVEARMRAAWNAAITEAADRCEAMCHYYQTRQRWTSADEAADTCKDEMRKLRSAPNVGIEPPKVGSNDGLGRWLRNAKDFA